MRVKITSTTSTNWYNDMIGEKFDVNPIPYTILEPTRECHRLLPTQHNIEIFNKYDKKYTNGEISKISINSKHCNINKMKMLKTLMHEL